MARHEASGRRFTAAGISSFTLDQGEGEAVLCLHGVPASSYLYRALVPALAERGVRALAFDLPGLGLADRPADFDYSWTGLGAWAAAAVDALGLGRFHLVVHDIGGPVGFELAARTPDRVASMTVLNTLVEVDGFTKPWVMRPFALPLIGPAYLAALTRPVSRVMMRRQGVLGPVPGAELDVYVDLLKRGDRGRAFLRIMRGFETTAAKQRAYAEVLARHPAQVIWGEHDPTLRLDPYGLAAQRATGAPQIHLLPGKHFLPEDNAPAIADLVARLVEANPG